MNQNTALMIGGAVAVAALVVASKGAREAGAAIGNAAVDLVDGALGGAVVRIGETIGIPATNESECERAIREGRTWDASFACPAKRFVEYVVSGK